MLRTQLIFLLALLASGCLENKALANPLLPRPGDRAQFGAWLAADPTRAQVFARFERFLEERGVHDVVPPWQLWRQGSDWRAAGEPAFAVPPEAEWAHIVPTLNLVRAEIIPRMGAVSVWSARRTPGFNRKAGGAKSSAHLGFRAVDLVPARCDKNAQHKALYRYWQSGDAKRARVGIGFYDSPICRVHVDTGVRHRRWGRYPGSARYAVGVGEPNKPVAGPRFDEQDAAFIFTEEVAAVLADAWVSEKNRLPPGFESAPDARDDAWQRQRNPGGLLIVVDLFHHLVDFFTRRSLRRSVVEDLGVPRRLQRHLRVAFDAAWSDPRVRTMHDAEQRAHLARVLFDTAQG